jgi:hypothetical protein
MDARTCNNEERSEEGREGRIEEERVEGVGGGERKGEERRGEKRRGGRGEHRGEQSEHEYS